jgi:hypothetical protein
MNHDPKERAKDPNTPFEELIELVKEYPIEVLENASLANLPPALRRYLTNVAELALLQLRLDAAMEQLYKLEDKRIAALFAIDCAARVLPLYEEKLPGDHRLRSALEGARKAADGLATDEEIAAFEAQAEQVQEENTHTSSGGWFTIHGLDEDHLFHVADTVLAALKFHGQYKYGGGAPGAAEAAGASVMSYAGQNQDVDIIGEAMKDPASDLGAAVLAAIITETRCQVEFLERSLAKADTP